MAYKDDEKRKAELAQLMKDACHLDPPANHQAFNQAVSQAEYKDEAQAREGDGLFVAMPDVWQDIDAMPPQTQNHDMRRLAASTVEEYLRWVETSEVTGPYALFGFDPHLAFDLTEHTVSDLVAKYLSDRYTRCDVGSSVHCTPNNAGHVLKIQYGENVCLYKCCDHCRAWFDDDDRHRSESINFALPDPQSAFGDNPRHLAT